MYAQWICVFLCAAAFAANAAVIPKNNSSTPSSWNHTIIEGRSSVDNVLIHTEVILDSLFFFTDEDDLISRFEIIDLDGISEYAPTYSGGVGRYYLFVHPPRDFEIGGGRHDHNETVIGGRYLVNIFKAVYDREMFRGVLNNRSSIVHTATFDDHVSYYGNEEITAFHIEALSEESVSTLSVYGGLGHNYLFVVPATSNDTSEDSVTSTDAGHNFNITIYSELARQPNHFVHGEWTPRSHLIFDQRVTASDLFENTFTVSTNNWNVTQVRLTDLTEGYGGRVEVVTVIPDERVVVVRFEEHVEINFDLEIFAELRTQ